MTSRTATPSDAQARGTQAGPYAVRLRLIGPMEAWTGSNQNILPLGRKTRALLAILALAAPRPIARARLAELLWSRRLEEQARASLRQEIHRLLDALQPAQAEILRVTRDQLAIRPELVVSDVDQVLRASTTDPSGLELLDGPLLEDFSGVDPALDVWLVQERERLRERVRDVAEAILRGQIGPGTTVFVAQRLLALDRGHEGAWRALIRAHADRGERGLAIQTFERCRDALAAELGAAPSGETQSLVAGIRAGQGADGTAQSEAVRLPPDQRATSRGGVKIGVLPLHLLSTGEEESGLITGFAEELTATMARCRWLGVVSASSIALSGSRDEAVLQRQFGLDFLLDGSVHRVSRRLRITMQLIDLRAGNQVVWARRFDRQIDDTLSLQDDIAAEVVAQIDPEIMLAESRRVTRRPVADRSAYDLVLGALPLIHRLQRDDFAKAGTLLARALAMEPNYAAAHAWRAYWLLFCVGQGWTDRPAQASAEAGQLAERAIVLDPQDARGFTIAGHVRAFLHRRPREALELHGHAVALNPNLSMAWGFSAVNSIYLGDIPEARRRFARYRQLAAVDPSAFFHEGGMALMEIASRDYGAAIELSRRTSELSPNYVTGLKHYLCALGHAGAVAEAGRVRDRLLVAQPDFTIGGFIAHNPFALHAEVSHYAAGLRRGGLPEGQAPGE